MAGELTPVYWSEVQVDDVSPTGDDEQSKIDKAGRL
jgi:hypothetical protein